MARKIWRWKGRELEEVKEFRYLEYAIQRNGEQETQVRDRAMAVMGQVWGREDLGGIGVGDYGFLTD